MRLINNRYRIDEIIKKGYYEDSYLIEDLWDNDNKQYMKILDKEKHSNIISYFIDNFLELYQIRHKNLLSSDHFGIIDTINLKKSNNMLYYLISEYTNWDTFDKAKLEINLQNRLYIILELMSVIDYLHFRGFAYKYLCPSNIYYTNDGDIKLLNISSLLEKTYNAFYDNSCADFIAPEVLMNPATSNFKSDNYSLGMIMKYLLLENHLAENEDYKFKDAIDEAGKVCLIEIINNLICKDPNDRSIPIRSHIDNIISTFNMDYNYDLIAERDTLFFKTRTIGLDQELKEILEIDLDMQNNNNSYRGCILQGSFGSGKSKLLKEATFRLHMKGREIHKLEVVDNDTLGTVDIINQLKQITANTSSDILNRYIEDFSTLIPELINAPEMNYSNLNFNNDKYRIFNRICKYISEISRDRAVYLVIENLEKANAILLDFIDYLFNNINSNRFLLLMSYNDETIDPLNISDRLIKWSNNKLTHNIRINNLCFDDCSKLVKSILGISYIPNNFSNIIYRESKGNPSYIDFIIKDLYDRKELYLDNEGCWEVKDRNFTQITFPSNYSETIINQLSKYEGKYLDVIKAMSIYNTMLSKRMLLDIVGSDVFSLDQIIDDLLKNRIVVEKEVEWGYNYSLFSEELKRYVYVNLHENEKLELHQIAANTILDLYSNNIKLVLDELVFHLLKFNEIDLAIDVLAKEAGKLDNRNSSNAILLWDKAYSIIKDKNHKDKLKILDNLTDLYLLKGDTKKVDIYLNELTIVAEEDNNIEYIIKAKYYKAESLLNVNQLNDLNIVVESLELLSRNNNNVDGIILALLMKARMLFRTDDTEHILEVTNEALVLSNKYNIRKHLGSIHNINGIIYNIKGNTEESLKEYKKSINYYEESDKPYEVVKAINNIGSVYFESCGDFEMGLEYYEQALEISSKYGLINMKALLLNNIGEVYYNTLDYKNALDNLYEAKRLAEICNSIRLIYLTSINLGYINLYTNQLDKAYDIYLELNKLNITSPMLDGEVKYLYNNFLGEFYFYFGKFDLAEEYSRIASELYKDYNINEYLRAESRLIYIKYLKEGSIDKEYLYSIINKYIDAGLIGENLKFIVNMAKLSLMNYETELSKELIERYHLLKAKNTSSYLSYTCTILELLLLNNENSLIEVEKVFNDMSTVELLSVDVDFRMYLGLRYIETDSFSKSLRQFLEALDNVYKMSKYIPNGELKYNLIKLKNADLAKEKIVYIMDEGYGKKLNYLKLEDVNNDGYDEYFDISPVIDMLSKDEFYDILYYQDNDFNIRSIGELLLEQNDNCNHNLNLILKYIGRETLALNGLIIKVNEENSNLEVVSSLIEGDIKLPDEVILFSALRNKEPVLYNQNTKKINKCNIEEFIAKNIAGLICIPICAYDRYTLELQERRKSETVQDNKLIGYIYLETKRALNRFDNERCNLISALSNLIYLNIENEQLRTIATTDKITGTFTRTYFDDRFDNLLNVYNHTENSFSVLMLDIDKFKNINDTYGHLKGDTVLAMMGKSIKESIRETDIVGRYGGEEFIVILQNINIEDSLELANKIRSKIEKLVFPGINRPITISIGLSQYPEHSNFKDELIFKADQALYYAKEVLGRNKRALWYPGMDITSNKIDKLLGLITGDPINDKRNILALIDISELTKARKSSKEKAYDFLGRLIEVVEVEYASMILLNGDKLSVPLSRKRNEIEWVEHSLINYELVSKVIDNRKGQFYIDWDNVDSVDKIGGNPNWQSVLIVPLTKDEIIRGIVYLSIPLLEKEFGSKSLNICSILSNVFAGNI